MRTDGLYHASVMLPAGYRHPNCVVGIEYSRHAKDEARRDRYGLIDLPASVNLSGYQTVEVEVVGGAIHKIVVRGAMDDTRDRILVLMPRAGRAWLCKTTWVNLRSDSHKTLDRSRYVH